MSKNQISNVTLNPTHPAPTQPATGNLQEEIRQYLEPYQDLTIPNPLDPDFQEPPKYGDYTKLEEGENRLRILSEAIIGCEYWIDIFNQETRKEERKPIRRPIEEATELPTTDWSYFWACFIWNYKAKKIQILNTTKKGIRSGLESLSKNASWGDLTEYDICINKKQTDPTNAKKADYSVTPLKNTVLEAEIFSKWQATGFDRNALLLLFAGLDPFELQRKVKAGQ
jgi:hypothetical protein